MVLHPLPCSDTHTLILHWNGKSWSKVTSASTTGGLLFAVSAASGINAWAAGSYCASACAGLSPVQHTLILRWNGKSWSLRFPVSRR